MKKRTALVFQVTPFLLLLTGLTACGGGESGRGADLSGRAAESAGLPVQVTTSSEDLPTGVSAAMLDPQYGQPRSEAEQQAAARTLSGYFNGRHAGHPEALMGVESVQVEPKAAPHPRQVYRFFNTLTGVHFYTISVAERDAVQATLPWFVLEGGAFHALQSASAALNPVYRFYNLVTGTHFYTVSEAERAYVASQLSAIYRFEGVSWHASTSGGSGWTPIHRFFNRVTGTHFYTASESERLNVIATLPAFNYEGIGYYVRTGDAPFMSGNVVVNGPVRNAVVCLDLNGNSACDGGEPAAPVTGANGTYQITISRAQVSEEQQRTSSLIASMVPGAMDNPATTIDQGFGRAVTAVHYVLRLPPDEVGQISPLSTLVAAGVAGGMTLAQARANAAAQLGITTSKIDNYLDDPVVADGANTDSARLAAVVVARALEAQVPLEVGTQTAAVSGGPWDLRSLRYIDADNHNFLAFSVLDKAEGVAGASLVDLRAGRSAGQALVDDTLYNQAYLAPAGWTRCDSSVLLTATLGTPNRSTFCNVSNSLTYRQGSVSTSVAGRAMAEVVDELQADPGNTVNVGVPTAALTSALGAATFPSGSLLRPGFTLTVNQPVYINSINTDGRLSGDDASLEQLMEFNQSWEANSHLPDPSHSLSLGLSSGQFKNLRVAFNGMGNGSTGPVQFYECDLNESQTVAFNCVQTQTGAYQITTIHGARVMSFSGHAPTIMNHERVYTEVLPDNQANGVITPVRWVFSAQRRKADFVYNASYNTRFNMVAWGAMRSQLGM